MVDLYKYTKGKSPYKQQEIKEKNQERIGESCHTVHNVMVMKLVLYNESMVKECCNVFWDKDNKEKHKENIEKGPFRSESIVVHKHLHHLYCPKFGSEV